MLRFVMLRSLYLHHVVSNHEINWSHPHQLRPSSSKFTFFWSPVWIEAVETCRNGRRCQRQSNRRQQWSLQRLTVAVKVSKVSDVFNSVAQHKPPVKGWSAFLHHSGDKGAQSPAWGYSKESDCSCILRQNIFDITRNQYLIWDPAVSSFIWSILVVILCRYPNVSLWAEERQQKRFEGMDIEAWAQENHFQNQNLARFQQHLKPPTSNLYRLYLFRESPFATSSSDFQDQWSMYGLESCSEFLVIGQTASMSSDSADRCDVETWQRWIERLNNSYQLWLENDVVWLLFPYDMLVAFFLWVKDFGEIWGDDSSGSGW